MSTIKLEVVSPDKVVYTEDINMLIVRSTGGELGILPHHAPLVTGLVPHAMRVRISQDRDEQLIAVAGGFMEVTPEKITVLATSISTGPRKRWTAPKSVLRNSISMRPRLRTSISNAQSLLWDVPWHACVQRRQSSDPGMKITAPPNGGAVILGICVYSLAAIQAKTRFQPTRA